MLSSLHMFCILMTSACFLISCIKIDQVLSNIQDWFHLTTDSWHIYNYMYMLVYLTAVCLHNIKQMQLFYSTTMRLNDSNSLNCLFCVDCSDSSLFLLISEILSMWYLVQFDMLNLPPQVQELFSLGYFSIRQKSSSFNGASVFHRHFNFLAYISASNWNFADEHKSLKRKAMVLTSSISLATDSIFLRDKLSKLFPMDPYLPPWHVEPSSTCHRNSFLLGIFRFVRRVRLSMESGVTLLQIKKTYY